MSEATQLPDLLTVSETAAFLRLSSWRVYELIRQKQLPAIKLGRTLRVPRDRLLERLDLVGTTRSGTSLGG